MSQIQNWTRRQPKDNTTQKVDKDNSIKNKFHLVWFELLIKTLVLHFANLEITGSGVHFIVACKTLLLQGAWTTQAPWKRQHVHTFWNTQSMKRPITTSLALECCNYVICLRHQGAAYNYAAPWHVCQQLFACSATPCMLLAEKGRRLSLDTIFTNITNNH